MEAQTMADGEQQVARQRKIIMIVAAVAAILIAGIIGLTVGKGAAPDEADPTLTTKENFVKARDSTLADVAKQTAKEGYEAGRQSGARQGGRAGRRAGQSDGTVAAQLEITAVAQSEASSAQAELDSISAPPPAPTAPVAPTAPPSEEPGR
jgi:flagellar biosynthesis/type III secretory pathway protein FliH